MSVKKEKNGKYKVVYYRRNPDTGKLIQTTKRGFASRTEAEFFDASAKINKKSSFDIGKIELNVFVDMYMKDKSNLKEKSLDTKRNVFDKHVLNKNNEKGVASFRGCKLNDITAKALIDWQNMKMKEGYSDSYLRTIRKELSTLLNHAEKIYGWENNPSKYVERMGSSDSGEMVFWTYNEYLDFIKAVPQDSMDYIMFELLFYSGMRLGELLALTPKDIFYEKRIIRISKTFHRKNNKDILTEPKTKESKRDIYMPQFVMDELKEYESMYYALNENDRLFPVVHKTVENHLSKYIEKAGSKYIHVHCLRHSHVAYLIDLSIDIYIISKRLGHKDIKITINKYGHLYPDKQQKVADLLDNEHREQIAKIA